MYYKYKYKIQVPLTVPQKKLFTVPRAYQFNKNFHFANGGEPEEVAYALFICIVISIHFYICKQRC